MSISDQYSVSGDDIENYLQESNRTFNKDRRKDIGWKTQRFGKVRDSYIQMNEYLYKSLYQQESHKWFINSSPSAWTYLDAWSICCECEHCSGCMALHHPQLTSGMLELQLPRLSLPPVEYYVCT